MYTQWQIGVGEGLMDGGRGFKVSSGWLAGGALLILIRCLFSNKHVLAQKCKILFRVVASIVPPLTGMR